jgi:hypothetical protein
MLKRVNRRADKIKKSRQKNARLLNPRKICLEAVKELMDELPQSHSFNDFTDRLHYITSKLDKTLQLLDPQVEIQLTWNDISADDMETRWQDMHINSLRVNWSTVYRAHHMKEDPSIIITVSDILLEDLL